MANSNFLRENKNQHINKVVESKYDDYKLKDATTSITEYVKEQLDIMGEERFQVIHEKNIPYPFIYEKIRESSSNREIDGTFEKRTIEPDGGIIYLFDSATKIKLPLLISEAKRQGTNDKREKEGKKKQSQGNAIERLGKNLIGIKTMMLNEDIIPFVVFGWGWDFGIEQNYVRGKVSLMNEMYPLNKTYIFKEKDFNGKIIGSPVSMHFRKEKWTTREMYDLLKVVVDKSLSYYLDKYK